MGVQLVRVLGVTDACASVWRKRMICGLNGVGMRVCECCFWMCLGCVGCGLCVVCVKENHTQ